MGISRRDFLARVGQAGGYSAAFVAMQGIGLMPQRTAVAQPLAVAPGAGKGTRVAILGGGIAGLVAAYEMRALGYDVTVLEARERPGGRNWTVRRGDTVVLLDGSKQTCAWDEGHYQNFGPGRLPSIHGAILGYCRRLGVPLEVEVNNSRSTFLQSDTADGGKPIVQRQAVNDTRGHVSELLAKSIRGGALDADLSAEDRDRMLSFLRLYGSLDEAGKYTGCDRAGYAKQAGAGDDAGVLSQPLDMHTLLDENFWQGMLFDEAFDMQATMFQPIGGMDAIPKAFAKALGNLIRYNAPVTGIRRTPTGVRILYTESGKPRTLEAAYCLCALPLSILKRIPNDFSPPVQKVIAESTYSNAYKVAWESRRFWEQDDNIYGGLEFVTEGCSPVWLPSANLFSERGVLVSGYGWESEPAFDRLALAGKFAESRRTIERLHPGHGRELEKPLYVGWAHVEHSEGAWIDTYGTEPEQGPGAGVTNGGPSHPTRARTETNPGYETLIQPDGPFLFIGDHVSHVNAWQEGAALSALRAVQLVSDHVKATRLSTPGSSTPV